eukprot:gnl/TRDRNA2_/TRDRNA2_169665_c0_seq1.p1 gnl/TRDRNA2_/TRDRNA2_169665_c0~~gnl/TRDRNA2_/TRDRNA2_169665_c0_seq1.p1  ORF type:complete len:115 (-),score=11.04 gnl/TRDRNA2_/TRDRNA2_169665_c0_seq1:284-628(-)
MDTVDLKTLSGCIDEMVAELANRQAAGAEVRLGTPWSFCCRPPWQPREMSYRRVGVIAQLLKDAAFKYNIPLWDIWQLSNGWEEDTMEDTCNHQNSEQYHVNFQVLCNTLPGAI